MQAILRHINFDVVKCIIIASPGFVKDQFYEYMFQTAIKTDNKLLLENKGKFVLVHASSGFKHSLRGLLCIIKLFLLHKSTISPHFHTICFNNNGSLLLFLYSDQV